jgi:RNA polymerase sigma-70 factor (ECF subfamily)
MIASAGLMASTNDAKTWTFESVASREKQRLFRLALSILGDRGEAEDAVQETLIKAWKSWGSLRDLDKSGRWLTKVCANHCVSRRRSLISGGWLWRSEPSKDAHTAGLGFGAELMDLDRAYEQLSVKQRAALTLNYRYGYAIEECAELMGCRPGTVRSHLGRALITLRKEMGDG